MEKIQMQELAQRIRELRDISGYSIKEISEELGVSQEVYEGYEKDGSDIPISVIYELSVRFGMDFTEILTGNCAKMQTYQIVRRGKGEVIDRYPGYCYQDLGFKYNQKLMQPLIVTLEPSDETPSIVRHHGQEFNLVLEGEVLLMFDGKEIYLKEGDSIYFNPEYDHSQKCIGDKKAIFLVVITDTATKKL